MSDILDCAVIGSGPAGLSAAINLHQRGKTVRILGATPSLLAKAEQVDNYPGLPGVTGEELMLAFTGHAASLGLRAEAGKVANIMPMGDTFMINFDGDILTARTVILATGVYRAAPVAGEAEFLGRGVSYCATCDGMLYKGKKVVVWGVGAEAVHEADFLVSLGCQVTFVAGKQPDGEHGFTFIKGRVSGIEGDMTVTKALVNSEPIPCEGVFILRDAIAPSQLVTGLETVGGHVAVDRSMETALPGLFAAGDITGEPYQIAKAVGEGQTAGLAAAARIDQANKN